MMADNDDSDNQAGPASAIQAIDRRSVHRICSGQVVLTLATAVKELVENSLDAGATCIEVRLKEYGSELLEVVDNGCGVEEKNFEGLTLKHHTSKLRDFDDLVNVETFGFRGEALSSLCALSNLTVTTCHESTSVGTRLDLDYNGKINTQKPCARQKGTTVSLGQLFHTLPVRHREFQRNLKKEFSKMLHVLNGKKNIMASTNGNASIKENITNIFGPKQVQSLLEFEQSLPEEKVCQDFNIKVPDRHLFNVSGYVSSSEHGKGRGVADRQFTFINRRPFDHSKLSRIVNEVYHTYNRHQYPFLVLNISLDKDGVDVNVTPDKRQVFISSEKILLATVKTSLAKMFEPISSVFQANQGQGKSGGVQLSNFTRTLTPRQQDSPQNNLQRAGTYPGASPKKSLTSTLLNLKRSFSSAFAKADPSPVSTPEIQQPKQPRLEGFFKRSKKEEPAQENDRDTQTSGVNDVKDPKFMTSQTSLSGDSCQTDSELMTSSSQNTSEFDDDITVTSLEESPRVASSQCDIIKDDVMAISGGGERELVIVVKGGEEGVEEEKMREEREKEGMEEEKMREEREREGLREEREMDGMTEEKEEEDGNEEDAMSEEDIERKKSTTNEGESDPQMTLLEYDEAGIVKRKSRTLVFSFSSLRESILQRNRKKTEGDMYRSFRAKISPTDNQAAEQELQKEIKKDMFPKMEILGQFNLGFILTKHGSDLFIVDQHATDEKYNFEMLQRHTTLHSQKLIHPQSLELTAANSTVLLDNIDIFKTNGFEFDIDEEAPITSRVRLASMPVSKNWTFGKDDIEELIFMLKDSPGVLCRPSRVRMMFASRACRKSIMVGTALNKAEMRKVINHMADIDQPWNCPHGRPTMRHLINLDCLQDLGQKT